MNKKELRDLVSAGYSTYGIAELTGKSQTNVRYWLKKHNLKTVPVSRLTGHKCRYCTETNEDRMVNMGGGRRCRTVCKKCHSLRTVEKLRRNKQQAVEYKGGKCIKCSYNLCNDALEFHHRNQSEKDPAFNYMKGWAWERAKIELDKCDLVCSNCHKEKHAGLW